MCVIKDWIECSITYPTMKKIYCLAILLLSLISCKTETETSDDVHIHGTIDNPSSDYVIISRNNINLDTLLLNENNKFEGKLENADPGIYVFKHPPENQLIYLEPGDSTLIFVNTLAFDESIYFSGKGAEKRNFLTRLYLSHQQNNKLILADYKLEPEQFALKSDSIRNTRRKELEELQKKYNFSEEFSQLANASINYEFYDLRERYALLIRKYNKEFIKKIPKDFHDYRRDVSLNDEQLQDHYIYLNFIDDYLSTRSLECCEENNSKDPDCGNLLSPDNISRRISMVNNWITNERIKNSFIDRLVAQGIIYSRNREDIDDVLNLLQESNYSGNRLQHIRQMAGIQAGLLTGNNIGDLKMRNLDDKSLELNNVSKKPKITYHWSIASQHHYQWQKEFIEDLRFKYPEISFIGINIDKENFTTWSKVVKLNYFDPRYEFQLETINVNPELLRNYSNKLLFIDPSGEIVRGDIRMNDPELETKILAFISN